MKNNYNFMYILLSIAFKSIGAISSKYAAITLSGAFIIGIITNIFYFFSLLCLLLTAIVWQQALGHYPLSFAYPFMTFVNFIVLIASALLFNEGITAANIIGMIIISAGITMLTYKNGGILCSSP
jgi:multidrug transporter EmrE-like cation transporter